jgi:dolichol-phosphate mannosyltransferase
MISLILPTYNEVENIQTIISMINDLFIRENIKGEIIVMDDNSPDGTADTAKSISVECPVRVYVRKMNRGLSKAVIEGLKVARNDICVLMDADLSHPVDSIPNLVRPILKDECDMTIGSRYIQGGGWVSFNPLRGIVSKAAGFLAKGVIKLSDPTSGFMAIRKSCIDDVNLDPVGWKIVLEMAVKAEPRIKEIPISFSERSKGKSKLGISAQIEYFRHLWKLYSFKRPGVIQFVKFCLVGFSGVFIDTLVLICLVELVYLDPRFAAVFAFMAAVTWNYISNRIWTFKKGKIKSALHSYFIFIIICILGLGIRIGVMHLLIRYAGMSESPRYILASLFGIAAATIFNFLGSKYLVFSRGLFDN